jgi:hypothetical protein
MFAASPTSPPPILSGSIFVLIQFDVCEELRLDLLQQAISARTVAQPRMKQPAPAYVRYQKPPIAGPLDPLILETGERLEGEVKFYDYGIASVIYQLPFAGDWDALVRLASHWVWEVDFASRVEPILRARLEPLASAMIKPYARWLSEDYFIFHVREAAAVRNAAELSRAYGPQIAQVVRGDRQQLAQGEVNEVLSSQISYYAADLAVLGWNAAFLYDTPAGADTSIQLLEYANSQLLEFRHYDEQLTGILDSVYDLLAEKRGYFTRWGLARSARGLHTVLLDVTELTERADNAIKFLSDMFAARFYKLATVRVGVPDYKELVARKLRIAEDLYQDMVEQFNQSRAFFLEVTVVLILLIELVYLFKGQLF